MHTSALLNETIKYLNPESGDKFIDATFGFGGHSSELLKHIEPDGKILAFEWDPVLFKAMKEELSMKKTTKKIVLKNKNFKHIKKISIDEGFTNVKGVMFDLGVSTWHYKNSGRGFGFGKDEPLDMRINPDDIKMTAFEVVNYFSEKELTEVFRTYGEERQSSQIAQEIVKRRKIKKIETSEDLSEIIVSSKRTRGRSRKNPATKIFMALRTFINGELENLQQGLKDSYNLIQPGGRIVILSFQGLEDVIIKKVFKELKKSGANVLTKNVVRPVFSEMKANPSSRSAKLRALMKPLNE